jgi:hypothetical protein
MKLPRKFATIVLVFCQCACSAQGQKLDEAEQARIIEKTLELFRENYIFPDKAAAAEKHLRSNLAAKKYSSFTLLNEFLENVNRDLQSAANDKHVRINNNPRIVEKIRKEAAGQKEDPREYINMIRSENFRLKKVETLDGNIGYFKFDNFLELQYVKDAFTGAMNFLHHTSAIILDLTDNGGGASETSDYLLSYFLPDSTIVGESWTRKTNITTQSILKRDPAVRQMLTTPVYVLVSNRTASAAEGVAYTLQQFKRAVVVGEQTRGLGNPGELFPINERLFIMIPTILNKNAVTSTNWDGVGVTPDISVEPSNALNKAMVEALKNLAAKSVNKKESFRYKFIAQEYESLLSPQAPPPGFISMCIGKYEDGQEIRVEDGILYYTKGDIKRKLTYMRDQTFLVNGRKDYRIRFPLVGNAVKQCEVLWFDDTSDTYNKVN